MTKTKTKTKMLDLREMRGPEYRVERTCPVAVFVADPADEYRIMSDVALALRVRKDGEKCRLTGGVRTRVQLSCCRCLEPFEVPSDLEVDLLYLPHSANVGEAESEITAEELSTAFYRDDQIDLGELVREQLQLSLPMKPLCRDDCRGLCPVCGTNLNTGRCSCDARWHDPRFAELEALRSDRTQQ
jgi:uncharacterized protein